MSERYEIRTSDLSEAAASLVEAAKLENLRYFKAECHDGSVLTIRFKKKPAKKTLLRELSTGPVYCATTQEQDE